MCGHSVWAVCQEGCWDVSRGWQGDRGVAARSAVICRSRAMAKAEKHVRVCGVPAGGLCVAPHGTANAGGRSAAAGLMDQTRAAVGRGVHAGRAGTEPAARPPASGSSGAHTLSVRTQRGGRRRSPRCVQRSKKGRLVACR